MKTNNALKLIAASAGISWANGVFAHDGHGLSGIHWHATDTWGFVAVAALAGLAMWWSRGGKK
jgi:hypothetical protein